MPTFLKYNHSQYKDQLMKESEGLSALREHLKVTKNPLICIPEVYSVDASTLELEAISSQSPSTLHMEKLGQGLALLHSQHFDRFGLDRDNYLGLSPQPNHWSHNWGEFFVDHRLGFQVERIRSREVAQSFLKTLQNVRTPLISFLNQHCHGASLLHGDLWSGNVLFDDKNVWLIDPAIYYGDREADIAMTELFGGFGLAFYQAYDEVAPRSDVYPIKRIIYNLYHYLNHYNLFGDGYLTDCHMGFKEIQNAF